MRWLLCGAALIALGTCLPALADCAEDIAAVEQELATEPAPVAGESKPAAERPAKSPEEVVDQMVEEGVEVEENGGDTKFASGGLAEPRESWTSGRSPQEHPAVVLLSSAQQSLDQGDQQGCMDAVAKARAALSEEPAPSQ